jgi:hypothetical protein
MMKDGQAGHSGLTERPILNELKVIVAERIESGTDGTYSDICLTGLLWLVMIGSFRERETSRLSPLVPSSGRERGKELPDGVGASSTGR